MQPPENLCTTESESIAREFIDNWSHIISLLETNGEQDVMILLDLLESVRVKWQNSEAEAMHFKEKFATADKNNNELKSENERLNGKLLNCQSTLDRVLKSKDAIEDELKRYKSQWEKLRSILKDSDEAFVSDGLLAIINNVVQKPSTKVNQNVTTRTQYRNEETEELSTFESAQSDFDYDKTGESLNTSPEDYPDPSQRRPSRKRPSTSQTPQPLRSIVRFEDQEAVVPVKRSRNLEDIEITATIRFDSTGTQKPFANINIRRSRSESDVSHQQEIINIKPRAMTPHFNAGSTFSLQSPLGFAGSWTRGQDIDQRQHHGDLISFPISFSCDVCNKRFGFTRNAYECRDCNLRFHQKCQPRAAMPCVPKVKIPKTPSKLKNNLVDYCPSSHPFIPPLLIHCIVALERDHLFRNGIYRISPSPSAVKELYQQFLSSSSRLSPELTNVPMELITGCVKRFLKELRDSVIPSTSYNDFLQAVEENNEQKLIQTVFDLPAPHRDTLAYLILHLQKIAANSSRNQMPLENLATVLAPTMVGYSNLVQNQTAENAFKVNTNQTMILLRLLKIPSEFWNRFIENNMSAVLAAEARTPGCRTALLTVTPTIQHPPSSSSPSRSRTPKMPAKPKANNNKFRVDSQGASTSEAIPSPLFQPLSGASSTMRGISFKPAF